MSVTTKAQESFTNLRKRLDQLGYQHPLGIESLPLVERLFADLLHTTESLRNVKVRVYITQAGLIQISSTFCNLEALF